MTVSVNAKTYTADSFSPNATVYNGPAHTMTVLDDLRIARVAPKLTVVFSGVGRTSVKLARTSTLTGALTPTGVLLGEMNTSAPVGTPGADIDSLLNDMGAFIASATYKTLVKNLQVNF